MTTKTFSTNMTRLPVAALTYWKPLLIKNQPKKLIAPATKAASQDCREREP
jgi:hypothetical protein